MAATTDRKILHIAGAAGGVCTRSELRKAGVPDRTIGHRLSAGLLQRVGPGIYLVPGLLSDETRYYVAARAHPMGAVSHESAGRLWGFPLPPANPTDPVTVTVPVGTITRSSVTGVVLSLTRRPLTGTVALVRMNLRATGPARTIVDLAGTGLTDRRLRHVLQTQVMAGQLQLDDIAADLGPSDSRGVTGAARLRRLLIELDDGEPLPQSELERRASAVLGSGFRRQFRPPWFDGIRGVADFAHPATAVIVEADGRRWHTTDQSREEDLRRDRLATIHGWVVLRYSWRDLVNRPAATRAEIEAVVGARSNLAS